ncbi:MAG: STAS domain-containing protein [Thermodesulfobacteriota bacterium]
MEIQKRIEGDLLRVAVKGRLDAVTAPQFDKNLAAAVGQGEKEVLFDFSGLEYISSAGLRSLLVLSKRLKTFPTELLFSGLKEPVKEVFRISGFFSIFKIIDSPPAASDRT